MEKLPGLRPTIILFFGLFMLTNGLSGCAPVQSGESVLTGVSTAIPTLSLEDTYAREFVINDFDAVHSPVKQNGNEYLVFGNLPVSKPALDLPTTLAALLGRWEGYSYAPPVKKDRKVVLVIQDLTSREGKAVGLSGTNLQYPDRVGEIHFRVTGIDPPVIEFQISWPDGMVEVDTYTYNPEKDSLTGWAKLQNSDTTYGPTELTRDQTFTIYKDYPAYLAEKGITSRTYRDSGLEHYGNGYLLYLPPGYKDNLEQTWPLLFFLHGYGDRGDNTFLLAKASPFMYIREKGPLPFIIAAPLLISNEGYSSFPDEYLEGALAEIREEFRVDPKRIYLTGLSMGGEATYRFAVNNPEVFAAIAPLSAYVDSQTYSLLGSIKDVPVWAIHGSDDTVIPLSKAQQPVVALKAAGGNIRFTVLDGHDHDTWTDTYSEPGFYEWLLGHSRP